LSGSYHR